MTSRYTRNLIGLFFITFITAACSHIDFGTMWKYRNVDFFEVNPDSTRIAIELPEGVSVEKARVSLAGTVEEATLFDGAIDLDIIRSGPEIAALPAALDRERSIVLRVPRDQVEKARELQLQTSALQKSPGHNSLSVGFEIKSGASDTSNTSDCRNSTAFPTMSVWVKLEDAESYSRLVGEKAFRKILADSMAQSQCAAAGG